MIKPFEAFCTWLVLVKSVLPPRHDVSHPGPLGPMSVLNVQKYGDVQNSNLICSCHRNVQVKMLHSVRDKLT
jgi:hypothetical protein